MLDLPPNTTPSMNVKPSIFLDYGADGVAGEDAKCEICERGMRFKSRWQFTQGTVMSIGISYEDVGTRRVEAEGSVIECDPDGECKYLTTLVFLDIPPELRQALGRVGNTLTARPSCPDFPPEQ